MYSFVFLGQPVTFPREPGYVCKQAWTSSCWPVWNLNLGPSWSFHVQRIKMMLTKSFHIWATAQLYVGIHLCNHGQNVWNSLLYNTVGSQELLNMSLFLYHFTECLLYFFIWLKWKKVLTWTFWKCPKNICCNLFQLFAIVICHIMKYFVLWSKCVQIKLLSFCANLHFPLHFLPSIFSVSVHLTSVSWVNPAFVVWLIASNILFYVGGGRQQQSCSLL